MKYLILCLAFSLNFNVHHLMAQGTVIGVVDANRVIEESIAGKAFFKEMEDFSQKKKNEIERLVTIYENIEKDYRAKLASLSEDKRQEFNLLLQDKAKDIKRKQEDAEREYQLKLNKELDRFQLELYPLIRQIALEKGLDLVLNNSSNTDIVFVSERIDITQDVITKYDAINR